MLPNPWSNICDILQIDRKSDGPADLQVISAALDLAWFDNIGAVLEFLIAYLPDPALAAYLRRTELERSSKNTITNKVAFEVEAALPRNPIQRAKRAGISDNW